MAPGDRLVCAFVEPQSAGQRFAVWPLHVTIVPWFRLDDDTAVIAEGLRRALTAVEPFAAVAGETAWFGPRQTRPASLLRQPTPLTEVERRVRAYLQKKRAWLVDETTKRRYEFRPHVTEQGGTGLRAGDRFECDRLYIVEQKGGYKEIMSIIDL